MAVGKINRVKDTAINTIVDGWEGDVEFRGDLPITLGTPAIGGVYLVEKPTTILLGTYTTYKSGLYIRDFNNGNINDWRDLKVKVKFTDGEFAIVNTADQSKQIKFDLSLITTAITRTYQHQDKDGIIAHLSDISSLSPSNEVIINSDSDLDSLESVGEIVLDDNMYYRFGDSFTITRPFKFTSVVSTTTLDFGNNSMMYSGSGAFFRGQFTGGIVVGRALIFGNGTNEIWDVSGNANPAGNVLQVDSISFVGFANKGTIDSIGAINHSVLYANTGTGLIIKDIPILSINNSPINNATTSNSPQIVLDGTFGSVKLNGGALNIQNGESFLQISKNVIINGEVVIVANQFSNSLGGEFLATAKSNTGVTFSDNGSGKLRITSIAHGLTVEQCVSVSNSSSHDGDHVVLGVVDVNTFDLDTSFLGADSGDWTTGDSNDFLDNIDFEFRGNGDQMDSNEIGAMSLATPFTLVIASPGVPVELQGTIGVSFGSDTLRRFEFEVDGSGRITYVGTKEKEFKIQASITLDSVGGGKKTMVGFVGVNSAIIGRSENTQETDKEATVSPFATIILSNGDYISSFGANDSDSANLDVLNVNLEITTA